MSKGEHTILHNNSTKDYKKISASLKNYWKNIDKESSKYKERNLKISLKNIGRLKKDKPKKESIKKMEEFFNISWERLNTFEKHSYVAKYNNFIRRNKLKNIPKDFNVKGRKWYTNSISNLYLKETDIIPNGYRLGRYIPEEKKHKSGNKLSEERKKQISNHSSNCKWYNDGIKTHFCTSEKAEEKGWVKGRLKFKQREYKNHKVISIQIIETNNIQMYDLVIKDNHNFAVSAGVFVHNSGFRKDISDSVAGSLNNAAKSNIYQNELVQKDLDLLFQI